MAQANHKFRKSERKIFCLSGLDETIALIARVNFLFRRRLNSAIMGRVHDPTKQHA